MSCQKDGVLQRIQYTKATDRNILEKTYADNKDVHNVTLRPVSTGIKSILETLAGTTPQAAKADPESFIDARLTNKLEESGFFKGLMSRWPAAKGTRSCG